MIKLFMYMWKLMYVFKNMGARHTKAKKRLV